MTIEALQAPFNADALVTIQAWLGVEMLELTMTGLRIPTPDGEAFQLAEKGDWVIRDVVDNSVCVIEGPTFDDMFKPLDS